MPSKKKPLDAEKQAQFVAGVWRDQAARGSSYREQALKLFPHVCGRCGREFSGKRLRELTVHHKDSDHMNNPTDGSNWELLCLYCHDAEHEGPVQRDHYDASAPDGRTGPPLDHQPFEGLKDLLKPGGDDSDSK